MTDPTPDPSATPNATPDAKIDAQIDAAVPPRRPALLFVLGAFGLVIGALTSAASVNTGLSLLLSRDQYVDIVKKQNPMAVVMQPADAERFGLREAEAQYDRRTATLPLAAAGLVISCLLFSGALRSMMGDPTALATWSLAATAAIPHRLLTFVAMVVTGHDVEQSFGGLAKAPFLELPLGIEQTAAGVGGVILTLYFAACLLYLRRLSVAGRISAGAARSRP